MIVKVTLTRSGSDDKRVVQTQPGAVGTLQAQTPAIKNSEKVRIGTKSSLLQPPLKRGLKDDSLSQAKLQTKLTVEKRICKVIHESLTKVNKEQADTAAPQKS